MSALAGHVRRPLSLAMAFVVAGCTAWEPAKQALRKDEASANALMDQRRAVHDEPRPKIRVRDGIWLGDTGVRSPHGEPLPEELETSDAVTVVSAKALTLQEIAATVTEITGLPVTISPGDQDAAKGADGQQSMAVNFSGPLSTFLNLVTTQFNQSWRYRNGSVSLFATETRSFTLNVPGTKTRSSVTISNAAGSGGSSAGSGGSGDTSSSQGISTEFSADDWGGIEKAIQAMLPKNSTVAISPSTGVVTVTSTPDGIERVAKFVRAENERFGRQVAILVKVWSLGLAAGDDYGFDINDFLLTTAGSYARFGIRSVAGNVSGNASVFATTILSPDSAIEGSRIVARALSTTNNATLLTEASVTTLNNQAAPIQVGKQTSYIKSAQTSINANVITTTLEAATLTTGFSMNIVPRILANGEIYLTYNIGLADLASLKTVAGTTTAVQVPEVNTRGFVQTVKLRSGETLVMAGYDSSNSTSNEQGVGSPLNWLLGGGVSATRNRQKLIVTMTPVVLQGNRQIEASN